MTPATARAQSAYEASLDRLLDAADSEARRDEATREIADEIRDELETYGRWDDFLLWVDGSEVWYAAQRPDEHWMAIQVQHALFCSEFLRRRDRETYNETEYREEARQKVIALLLDACRDKIKELAAQEFARRQEEAYGRD